MQWRKWGPQRLHNFLTSHLQPGCSRAGFWTQVCWVQKHQAPAFFLAYMEALFDAKSSLLCKLQVLDLSNRLSHILQSPGFFPRPHPGGEGKPHGEVTDHNCRLASATAVSPWPVAYTDFPVKSSLGDKCSVANYSLKITEPLRFLLANNPWMLCSLMISKLFQLLSAISCSVVGKLSHGNLGIGRFC